MKKVFVITSQFGNRYTRVFSKHKRAVQEMFDAVNRNFDVRFPAYVYVDGEKREGYLDELFDNYEDALFYLCDNEDDELNRIFDGFFTFHTYEVED